MHLKRIMTWSLLVFVLVSIGYAIGKEVTLRSVRAKGTGAAGALAAPTPQSQTQADVVLVYYLHGNLRCQTCNRIEKTAKAVIERSFADDLRTGRMVWKVDNYQENEALGRRYDVSSSSVVLVALQGEKEIRHVRLDEVWTHASDAVALDAYLDGSITDFVAASRRAAP